MNMWFSGRIAIFVLVFITIGCVHGQVHAPYQVSIYLYKNYNPNFINTKNFPICSAVIIHPFFLCTTADCVHSHIVANNITYTTPLGNDAIYVIGGNFSTLNSNIKYVEKIHIHPEFNPGLLLNDIAIIQLTTPFDMGKDIQWIALPDYYTRLEQCSFCLNRHGQASVYPFSEPKRTSVVNNLFCRRDSKINYADIERTNLCSFYQFDIPYMCQVREDQLRLSRDRGMPLICGNRFAGALSVILPSVQNGTNSTNSCETTLLTNAYYTKINVYVNWIHNIMSRYAPQQTSSGQPVSLVPNVPAYGGVSPSKSAAKQMHKKSFAEITITLVTGLFVYTFASF